MCFLAKKSVICGCFLILLFWTRFDQNFLPDWLQKLNFRLFGLCRNSSELSVVRSLITFRTSSLWTGRLLTGTSRLGLILFQDFSLLSVRSNKMRLIFKFFDPTSRWRDWLCFLLKELFFICHYFTKNKTCDMKWIMATF